MRDWIFEFELIDENNNKLKFVESESELIQIEKDAKKLVSQAKREAWTAFLAPIKNQKNRLLNILNNLANKSNNKVFINKLIAELSSTLEPSRKDLLVTARKVAVYVRNENSVEKTQLQNWITNFLKTEQPKYSSHLYSETDKKVGSLKEVLPTYNENARIG